MTLCSTNPEEFELHNTRMLLDYDEFEKLLLGIAYQTASSRKKLDVFEEFLGETLDSVFRKANVFADDAVKADD